MAAPASHSAVQDSWVARVLHVDLQAGPDGSHGPDPAMLEKFKAKWSAARARAFDEVDALGSEVANVFQAVGLGQDFLVDFNNKVDPLRRRFDDPLAPSLDRLERCAPDRRSEMLPQIQEEISRLQKELASDPTIKMLQGNSVKPIAFAKHFDKPLRGLASTIGF